MKIEFTSTDSVRVGMRMRITGKNCIITSINGIEVEYKPVGFFRNIWMNKPISKSHDWVFENIFQVLFFLSVLTSVTNFFGVIELSPNTFALNYICSVLFFIGIKIVSAEKNIISAINNNQKS